MSPPAASPSPSSDPVLAAAERQIVLLAELGDMGMVLSRAFAGAGVAAAHAVEEILADEFWQPETGRARALAGAKDAADSFQKVARCARLSFRLELDVAEIVRDLRAGVVPAPKPAGAIPISELCDIAMFEGPRVAMRRGDEADEATTAERDRSDTERLVEYERSDVMVRAPFRQTVARIRADLADAVDWSARVTPAKAEYKGLQPKPADRAENRPPPEYAASKAERPGGRAVAFSP